MAAFPARPFKNVRAGVMVDPAPPRKWGWLILFASTTTLVCCVVPIIFVAAGLGAVIASTYSALPFLSTLGLYKEWTFGITGVLLLLAGWLLYRPGRACPADSELAKACEAADRINRRLLKLSVSIWLLSMTTAYLLLPLSVLVG